MTLSTQGLEARYTVTKNHDPIGKHDDCRYFVLDPLHDPIAVEAIRAYATAAGAAGNFGLRADLHDWMDRIREGVEGVDPDQLTLEFDCG